VITSTRRRRSQGGSSRLVDAWARENPCSQALHERARWALPSGLTHDVRHADPFPLSVGRAEGGHIREGYGTQAARDGSRMTAVGFLAVLRQRTYETGALLVFDEVVTGFRWAPGGVQELSGVLPDLTASRGRCSTRRRLFRSSSTSECRRPTWCAATTSAAATAIRREDRLGSLSPGREADITVFELVDEPTRLTDGSYESVVAEQSLVPRWVVRRGQPIKIKARSPSSGQVANAWA
jgi:hypothetical protein